jgi:hypothetical protein
MGRCFVGQLGQCSHPGQPDCGGGIVKLTGGGGDPLPPLVGVFQCGDTFSSRSAPVRNGPADRRPVGLA